MTCKTCKTYDFCTSCLNNTDFTFNSVNGTCVLKVTCPANCLACDS